MYFVYIIYSIKFNKIYIGYSSNLEERLKSHNIYSSKGWTKKFRPWSLVYSESIQTKSEALKREKQLKSAQGRQFAWKQVDIWRGSSEG